MTAPADQQERDRARLTLEANVVVEAGAGTGKTTLLTDRILFLLLGGKSARPITSIVALTFTEKAAAEIKVRLAERLSELVAAASSAPMSDEALRRAEATLRELDARLGTPRADALELCRAALQDLDKAQIGTIHSFAAHLLRLYPVEAGVDPGFTVDEGPLFEELFESEWAAWLDVELGENPPRAREWLDVLRLAPLEDVEALARELSSEKTQALGLRDEAAARWLESTADALERLPLENPKPRGKILDSIKAVSAHLRATATSARAESLPLPDALPLREFKPSAWPSNWDPAGEPLYETACAAASACGPEREALVRRAAALAEPFARRLRAAYARRGLVSFDGLLRRARDLVRDHPEVRERLKRQFKTLLIDEFQDTDPLQGELLLLLAEAPGRCASGWSDAALGAGRLFVVGDPKQSIYRFRGADIAAYQRFTEKILGDGSAVACDLKTNFRSLPGLIDPVNAVFEGSMRHRPGLQPQYKAIQSGKPDDGSPALEYVLIGPAAAAARRDDAEAVQKAEAAWIARWILDNCGEGRRYRFRDVAVLLRSSAPLRPLLEQFKARGVPYAVEMEKHFFGAPEIVDALNVLRAADDPENAVAVAGLLRSPLCGVTDAELYELARSGGLDYRREPNLAGRPAAWALFAFLRSLRPLVGRRPAGEIVAEALRRSPLAELCARAYHGEQTVSNLAKLARLAHEASDARGLTLREFIGDVEARMDGGRAEGESPLADEHWEAVRVMTIHKSKGLEFPVTFLSNVSSAPGGGSRRPLSLFDWGTGRLGLRLAGAKAASASMARLESEERERQEHETLRLLYVALTRAKSRLFVLGRHEGAKRSLASRLAAAGAWPRWDSTADELTLGGRRASVRRIAADSDPFADGGLAPAPAPCAASVDAEALAAAWRVRREALEARRGLGWTAAPTDYLRETPKPVPRDEDAPRAAEGWLVGSVCHRVLERWDFARGGDLERELARACAGLARLEPAADWPAVEAQAREILERFARSPQAASLADAEILGREMPFSYADGDAVVRGSVDLLYRKRGKLYVADYKTDRVESPADAADRRAKYERQGRAYLEAVERAWGERPAAFRLIFLRRPDLSEI